MHTDDVGDWAKMTWVSIASALSVVVIEKSGGIDII